MKKILLLSATILVVIGFFSCSISMEKRRYRPGYHVDMVKNRDVKRTLNQKENAGIHGLPPKLKLLVVDNHGIPKDTLTAVNTQFIHGQKKSVHNPPSINLNKLGKINENLYASTLRLQKSRKLYEVKRTQSTAVRKALLKSFGYTTLAFVLLAIATVILGVLVPLGAIPYYLFLAFISLSLITFGVTIYFGANKKMNDDYDPNGTKTVIVHKAKFNRASIAWILGGISIALALAGLVVLITASGFGAIGTALILLGVALLLAVAAIIVRFAAPIKKEPEIVENIEIKNKKTKAASKQLVNWGFVLSMVAIGLAAVGITLVFLIYPLGLIGWIIAMVAALTGFVAFCFGLKAIVGGDNSLKVKLTIIFGFIAFVIAFMALFLLFI